MSFTNNFQTQSSFATSQLNVIHKQFSETIKLCKLPPKSSEYGSGLLFTNNLPDNQTLQEASTEFSAWRKSFPEHSSFALSQQRVQCINCQLLLTKNLQNNSSGVSSQHGVHQCMEESRRILCGDLVTTAVRRFFLFSFCACVPITIQEHRVGLSPVLLQSRR